MEGVKKQRASAVLFTFALIVTAQVHHKDYMIHDKEQSGGILIL